MKYYRGRKEFNCKERAFLKNSITCVPTILCDLIFTDLMKHKELVCLTSKSTYLYQNISIVFLITYEILN